MAQYSEARYGALELDPARVPAAASIGAKPYLTPPPVLPLTEIEISTRTKNNRINKKCLVLVVIVFLIVVIAALGAGLGVASKSRHTCT